jgi:hypothetical protein
MAGHHDEWILLAPDENDIYLLTCLAADGKQRPCVIRQIDPPGEIGAEFGHQLLVHLQPVEKKGK